jgi:hypothetical protein
LKKEYEKKQNGGDKNVTIAAEKPALPEGQEPEEKEHVDDVNVYLDPVSKKYAVKSLLPPFYCLDIFFKYRLYDQACKYLYFRREFNDLL